MVQEGDLHDKLNANIVYGKSSEKKITDLTAKHHFGIPKHRYHGQVTELFPNLLILMAFFT